MDKGRKYGQYYPLQRTRLPQLPVTDTKEIKKMQQWLHFFDFLSVCYRRFSERSSVLIAAKGNTARTCWIIQDGNPGGVCCTFCVIPCGFYLREIWIHWVDDCVGGCMVEYMMGQYKNKGLAMI